MIDETRLERLVSAYFDQALARDERRELEAMLLGSAKARQIFWQHADTHGLTREWALRAQADGFLTDPPATPGRPPGVDRSRWIGWAGLGLAATLALVAAIMMFRPEPPEPRHEVRLSKGGSASRPPLPEPVALLAQAVDVVWAGDGTRFDVGAALPQGQLRIESGTLRLDFYSGARVFLQGPADFELLSPLAARLGRGKLTAHVPPTAVGFTVENGDLRVVDRGTEFGMQVDGPDDCEVHVFDGEVALQGAVPREAKTALFEGDGVSIRQGIWQPILASRAAFIDPAVVRLAAARESAERKHRWKAESEMLRRADGLIAYYTFEDVEPGSHLLKNRAADPRFVTDGTIIGCEPVAGRWPDKGAAGFTKTSDRVRFRATGGSRSVTLIASVRVDSLPLDHNALLSMSPFEQGEIHWKLNRGGRLLVGVRAEPGIGYNFWERLESPRIIGEQDFGRWINLCTVIDGANGVMAHYLDGEPIASAAMTRRPEIRFGLANLGNFDNSPTHTEEVPVRNFNGRIDEFAMFARALTPEEIRALR